MRVGKPIKGKPTSSRANVNDPTTAAEIRERIPPEIGMPPKINDTIMFISNPVPVESDAEPVYPIWKMAATTKQIPAIM